MAQYKSRDPQNPYRTGCLVGNYVEDKFGAEIAAKEVSIKDNESSWTIVKIIFINI